MAVTEEQLEQSNLINWTIFQEILMMDEDEEGFALSLIKTFVDQATGIFKEMADILDDPDQTQDKLEKLSSIGHYLKGSAAALGLQKVQYACERVQNYGKQNKFDNYNKALQADSLGAWYECCQDAFADAREYYAESKNLLSDYFQAKL